MRRFWPALLLLAFAAIPLYRALLMGQAIGPFDHIRQFAPWNAAAPDQPWDVLQADGVLQFYPWRDMVFDAWGKGQLPLWNPYQLAGTPLLANSQSAGFYPPHILLGLLHVPTSIAMTLLAWFHLAWAGIGVYFLSRRLGALKMGAVFAGASFSLSAFMLAWTALPSVITTVSWIPWILAFITCLLQGQSEGKERLRYLVGLAFCAGMMILAGHLQFVAYGFMAAVLYTLVFAFASAGGARKLAVLPVVLGLALGGILSLGQLLPVLGYSQFSHRRNTPTAVGYDAYIGGSIKPHELATLPLATLQGSPRHWSVREEKISAYWPSIVKQGGNFAESAVAVGPLVLALLFLVPWKRREVWPLAAMGLLSLLLALGTPLNRLLYFGVPGWSSTGSPGRIVVLFVMAASVLAGLAIRPMELAGRKKFLPLLPFVVTLPFLVWASSMSGMAPEGIDAGAFGSLVAGAISQAAFPMLIGIVIGGACIAVLSRMDDRRVKILWIAAPALLAWTCYASDIVPTGEPLATQPSVGQERVAIINGSWGLSQAGKAFMPPNLASLSRIHDLAGYDSLIHRDTVAMLTDVDGQPPTPLANGNIMFVKKTADPVKLADAGVTQVWSREPLPNLGTPTEVEDTWAKYTIQGASRAIGAEVVSDGYDRQELSVSASRVTIKDRNMPGWTASDGTNTYPVKGDIWREIHVPADTKKLVLRYDPPGLKMGLLIAGFAWLVLIALSVVAFRGTSRKVKPSVEVA